MRRSLRTLRPLPAVALLALSVVSCPVNPATGERQLILISERQEIEMGREGAQQVEAMIGLYDDSDLQAYVEEIGQELAAKSERPHLPWSFKVVDDPVVNAFALPGGFIYVTRGILGYFNSQAELAAVVGHEIGHVTARHSAEQLSRAQVAQLGVGVGVVFVPEIAQYSDFLSLGLNLMFLKFSRDDERQADDLGLRYMSRGGYDPDEMVDVFTMLGRVSEAAGSSGLPSWLSTHPDPGERQQRIERAIAQTGIASGGTVERDRYLQMIDGIVFGENPRQGFFRDGTFQHPDLQFRFEFPADWQTQNMSHAVAGLSPQEDAIIQLTLAESSSLDAAARSFLAESGIQAGSTFSQSVNGLPAYWAYFGAATQSGSELRGLVVFVEHQEHIYQILGYTMADRMGTYDALFQRSLASFDRLTDPAALNVQPSRIELVRLDRAMTLQEFAERYPSTVPTATLALINDLDEGATIPAGGQVKRVVGGVMPEQ
jgi:predicted Zn-dependent protease